MTKIKRICHVVFILLSHLTSVVYSQDDNNINNQYWLDLIPHFRISDKLEFYGDGSFRVMENRDRIILTIRPSLRFQVGPILSIHGGVGFFYNNLSDADNYLEIRPFEAVRIGWPNIGPLNFKHYFRLEQRYFNFSNEENTLLHRARYSISAKLPLNKKVVQNEAFYLPFSFEWLATSDDEISIVWASQTRLMIGMGYIFNKTWMLEFEYMRWWSKETPSDEFQASDQVFRLKILKSGWITGE